MTNEEMLALAREKLNPVVRGEHCETGFVSALIEGKNGRFYAGENNDLACGLGFCAAGAAAAPPPPQGPPAGKGRGGFSRPIGICFRSRAASRPFRGKGSGTTRSHLYGS